MKTALQGIESIPWSAGVYAIRNVNNGKLYIGSSWKMRGRLFAHLSQLRKGSHSNCYLQSAWLKDGPDAFAVEVLEHYCGTDGRELRLREEGWLKKSQSFDRKVGYNLNLTVVTGTERFSVESRERMRLAHHNRRIAKQLQPTKTLVGNPVGWPRGRKQTAEHRAKCGEARKGKPRSEETKRRISIGATGKHVVTAEARDHLRRLYKGVPKDGLAKQYVVTSPDGLQIEIRNLSAFCRDNGLSVKKMSQIACGLKKKHHGWSCSHGGN